MPGYMISSVISARLDAAATGHPWCTRSTWAPGHNGASAGYLKIAATTPNSPAQRWAALISGGLHARELAPPDALVSFVEKLITAYAASSDIVYPAWTAPDGTVYSSFTIPWPQIRSVVEKLDLYVAPVVNADGRDWALATLPVGATSVQQRLHKEWRKNRRPAPAGKTGDWCVGVDINRNFDIVWDFKKYYTPALAAAAPRTGISGSYDACEPEVYIGPSAESEPETQNLAGLMRSANISFFLDVHSYGRDILFSWGLETSQSNDDSQNFANSAFDGKRDGNDPSATAYAEYVPAADLSAAQAMAQRMADFILKKAGGSDPVAQSRSAYRPLMNGLLYPGSICTGLSVDYCFSRWFSSAKAGNPISPVMAFTLEVGGDPAKAGQDEGGFAPNYVTQYPKIEREIHAAVWGLLTAVAATAFTGPRAPAPPSPSSGGKCFIAGAAYGDPLHPSVTFLRDVRDRQLPVGRGGRAFAAALNRCYAVLSPPIARRLQGHPAAGAAVRAGLLDPLVAALRLVSRVTEGRPRLRAVLLATTFLAAAITAAAIAATIGAALVLAAKGVR